MPKSFLFETKPTTGKDNATNSLIENRRVPLLRFRNLYKRFGIQSILENVSGDINSGEVILLRGENGSGKTSLINILTGSIKPDRGLIEYSNNDGSRAKSFNFPLTWFDHINPFQRFTPELISSLGVGRAWQDVRLFRSLDLADNIAVADPTSDVSLCGALFWHKKAKHSYRTHRKLAYDDLARLGLRSRENAFADQISLGQSKRVSITRAIRTNARVLFLDEPLSGLDPEGAAEILTHLNELGELYNLTFVIIEHALNISLLRNWITKVWTLQDNTLVEEGQAVLQVNAESIEAKGRLHTILLSYLEKKEFANNEVVLPNARLTTFEAKSQLPENPDFFKVSHLIVRRSGRYVCGAELGISFQIMRNTVNLLEAPNGWGKSSLFECLTGLLGMTSGSISLLGNHLPLETTADQLYEAGIRALPCDARLFPSLTVGDLCRLLSISIDNFPLNCYINRLSGGQLRQLSVLTLKPGRVIIADEITRSLDERGVATAISVLLQQSEGAAVLILQPGSINLFTK